jgi:hypothetical protein
MLSPEGEHEVKEAIARAFGITSFHGTLPGVPVGPMQRIVAPERQQQRTPVVELAPPPGLLLTSLQGAERRAQDDIFGSSVGSGPPRVNFSLQQENRFHQQAAPAGGIHLTYGAQSLDRTSEPDLAVVGAFERMWSEENLLLARAQQASSSSGLERQPPAPLRSVPHFPLGRMAFSGSASGKASGKEALPLARFRDWSVLDLRCRGRGRVPAGPRSSASRVAPPLRRRWTGSCRSAGSTTAAGR